MRKTMKNIDDSLISQEMIDQILGFILWFGLCAHNFTLKNLTNYIFVKLL